MTKKLADGHTQTYVPGSEGKPGKYQYTHIVNMEKKLGRSLRPNEVIHHKDGNPSNNDLSNLTLTTKDGHNKIDPSHRKGGRTKGSKNGVRKSVNYND